jgi:hypothetical protein
VVFLFLTFDRRYNMGRKVIELDGRLFVFDDVKNSFIRLELKNDVSISELTPRELEDFLRYVQLK